MPRRTFAAAIVVGVACAALTGCSHVDVSLPLQSARTPDAAEWTASTSTAHVTSDGLGSYSITFEGPCGATTLNALKLSGSSLSRSADTTTDATAMGCINSAGEQKSTLDGLLSDKASTFVISSDFRRLTLRDGDVKLIYAA